MRCGRWFGAGSALAALIAGCTPPATRLETVPAALETRPGDVVRFRYDGRTRVLARVVIDSGVVSGVVPGTSRKCEPACRQRYAVETISDFQLFHHTPETAGNTLFQALFVAFLALGALGTAISVGTGGT